MSSIGREQLLDRIILNPDISILFQPISNACEQQILGYEALARGPVNSALHLSEPLFQLAEKLGLFIR